MTQLDLKKLSKGMNIKDKMRLLFEDMNRKIETADKESVLTPQERKAIVDDARLHTGEMLEIHKVHNLHRMALFISADMEITQFCLYLSISQLEKVLMGILLKDEAEDIVGRMIYDLARQNKQSSDNEIESRMKELRAQYKVDSILFKSLDFFTTSVNNTSDNNANDLYSNGLEPNQNIQKLFMTAFGHAKKLKKKLYELSYVVRKASIDFLPGYGKKLREESEDILVIFSGLDTTLQPLRVYRDYGVKFAQHADLVEPQFFEVIQAIDKQLELVPEEIVSLEQKIDKFLSEDLY